MPKSSKNKQRGDSNIPPALTTVDYQQPVIVSGNRFDDIAPYCAEIYHREPKKYGDILPWEFPQNAPREIEEAFIDQWFGKQEVHLQGGTTGEGSGYRFLKQVWYTIAIFNHEQRAPNIAQWWWEQDGNHELVNDQHMLEQMAKPDSLPESLFSPQDFQTYGEKLLSQVMMHIRQLAVARKDLSPAAKNADGSPVLAAISPLTVVSPAEVDTAKPSPSLTIIETATKKSIEHTKQEMEHKSKDKQTAQSDISIGKPMSFKPAHQVESHEEVRPSREPAHVTENRAPNSSHTPLRADNDEFVPRMSKPQESFNCPPQPYRPPGFRQGYFMQDNPTFEMQPPISNSHRGSQRGRRMSRGGRESHPRSRIGSNNFPTFDSTTDANFAVQQSFRDRRNTSMQPYMQHPQQIYGMPFGQLTDEHFPHPVQRAVTQPMQAIPQAVTQPELPYAASAMQPAGSSSDSSRRVSFNRPSNLGPNDVYRDFIGSNRRDVTQLAVFHNPQYCSEETIRYLFATIGLPNVDISMFSGGPQYKNSSSRLAFVRLRNHDDARHALQLNGHMMGDRPLSVEVSKQYWDPFRSRQADRQPGPMQDFANMHAADFSSSAIQDGISTPSTNPYDSPTVVQEVGIPADRIDRPSMTDLRSIETIGRNSDPSKGKHRKLPTQDARLMDSSRTVINDSPALTDASISTQVTVKQATPPKQKKAQKNKKDRQSLGGEPGQQAAEQNRSTGAQPSQEPIQLAKSTSKHKDDRKKQDKTQPVAADNAREPSIAGDEKALKVTKRSHTVSSQPTSIAVEPVANDQLAVSTSGLPKQKHVQNKHDEPTKPQTKPKQDVEAKQTAADAHESKLQTTAESRPLKISVSAEHPTPATSAQPTRIATPMRNANNKPSTTDESAPTQINEESKKPADLVIETRKASATSMPPTPASVYTTAPPTPLAPNSVEIIKELTQEKAQEEPERTNKEDKTKVPVQDKTQESTQLHKAKDIPEKPKGPAQTESLSMFGKKQAKQSKKKEKSKGTLKEKPKEVVKTSDVQQSGAKPAAAKPPKGKQKAEAPSKHEPQSTEDKRQKAAAPAASPVTSPSKGTLGTFSSFFGGLLSRQSSYHAQVDTDPDQSGHPRVKQPGPDSIEDTTGKNRVSKDSTDHISKPEDIDKAIAEASKKIDEHEDSQIAVNPPSQQTPNAHPPEVKSEAVGLGVSGIDDPPNQSNEQLIADTTRPTFERDKDDDQQSQSTHTATVDSTSRSNSPTKPVHRPRAEKKHLIEAPPPRNVRKRRQRRHSGGTAGSGVVLNSDSVISTRSSDSSATASGDSDQDATGESPTQPYQPSKEFLSVYVDQEDVKRGVMFILCPPAERLPDSEPLPTVQQDSATSQQLPHKMFMFGSSPEAGDVNANEQRSKTPVADSDNEEDNSNDLAELGAAESD